MRGGLSDWPGVSLWVRLAVSVRFLCVCVWLWLWVRVPPVLVGLKSRAAARVSPKNLGVVVIFYFPSTDTR